MLTTFSFNVTHDPILITNDNYAIEISLKDGCLLDSLTFDVCGHRLSSVARQLLAVVDDKPSVDFILDYARLIEKRFSEMDVRVFSIILINKDEITIEDSIDLLHDPSSNAKTRFQSFDEFTLA